MKMNKNYKHSLIALIIGAAIIFLLPATNGLTPAGVRMLGVFVPTIYLWLTCNPGWSSLISISMVAVLNIIDGTATFTGMWGSMFVAVLIPFFMLSIVLEETGAMEWLVRWILSRKFLHGRPTLFTIMFILAMLLASTVIVPIVVCVMFFKILKQICESIGYTRDDEFFRAHGMLIGWIGQTVDGSLIWGRAFMISMVAVIVGLGFENMTLNNLLGIGLIYILAFSVVCFLIIKLWWRPDVSKFKNYDDAAIREELRLHPMTKRGKAVMIAMLCVLIVYIVASLKFLGPVSDYATMLSIACPPTLACGILAIVQVDGEPVMDLNRAASKVSWTTIFFMATIMFYAGNFGSENFGITVFLQNCFGFASALPTTLMILVGFSLASLFTNFASNAVSCIAVSASFVPVMLAAGNMSRAQVLAFAALLIPVCGTAIATRSACATMGVVYCDDGIEYKGTPKYSAVVCILMVLFCTFIMMPIATSLLSSIV